MEIYTFFISSQVGKLFFVSRTHCSFWFRFYFWIPSHVRSHLLLWKFSARKGKSSNPFTLMEEWTTRIETIEFDSPKSIKAYFNHWTLLSENIKLLIAFLCMHWTSWNNGVFILFDRLNDGTIQCFTIWKWSWKLIQSLNKYKIN